VVAHLALRQQPDDRSAFAVADGVELGIQSALGSPDTTGNTPFVEGSLRCDEPSDASRRS
jgi:hypothetical protein